MLWFTSLSNGTGDTSVVLAAQGLISAPQQTFPTSAFSSLNLPTHFVRRVDSRQAQQSRP